VSILHSIASRSNRSRIVFAALSALLCVICGAVPAHAQWIQPTSEELSMTSQPDVPGADAIYLYSEQKDDDLLHQQSFYYRVKVLTEAGKERANVRLTSTEDTSIESYTLSVRGDTVTDIEGRTIHSDGTVIPFTGKPYERTVKTSEDHSVTETVFTLPDVQVGSILEYRYNVVKISEHVYSAPTWYIQKDLFVRKGSFSWKSLDVDLKNPNTAQISHGVMFTSTLPIGDSVSTMGSPAGGGAQGYHHFSLTVHDVPPIPHENYMPPLRSSIYRVNFYFAFSANETEFWKDAGRMWSREMEHFIGQPDSLTGVVQTMIAPGDTDVVQLKKIYAAVQTMDNTSLLQKNVEKTATPGDLQSAKDVWQHKGGTNDQLTELFIGLARAAGMKAYGMKVTNRDLNIFAPALLSARQLNDDVAIVVVDGKEQFFDPGEKDCPYGQMAWQHTGTGGMREMADGTTSVLTSTPEPSYTESTIQRIADLTLNADGTASGTVQISWTGAGALQRRQEALVKDEDELKHAIRKLVAQSVPAGMKVDVGTLDNLSDYEKPLVANLTVHGSLGAVAENKMTVPSQFFEATSKPLFPEPTRDMPIYFNHSGRTVDAMRVKLPAELQVASAPKDDSFALRKLATYHTIPDVKPGVVVMRRSYTLGTAFFSVTEYGDVKSFYDKVSADDQQPLVFSIGAAK
jgi:hypothetical protein